MPLELRPLQQLQLLQQPLLMGATQEQQAPNNWEGARFPAPAVPQVHQRNPCSIQRHQLRLARSHHRESAFVATMRRGCRKQKRVPATVAVRPRRYAKRPRAAQMSSRKPSTAAYTAQATAPSTVPSSPQSEMQRRFEKRPPVHEMQRLRQPQHALLQQALQYRPEAGQHCRIQRQHHLRGQQPQMMHQPVARPRRSASTRWIRPEQQEVMHLENSHHQNRQSRQQQLPKDQAQPKGPLWRLVLKHGRHRHRHHWPLQPHRPQQNLRRRPVLARVLPCDFQLCSKSQAKCRNPQPRRRLEPNPRQPHLPTLAAERQQEREAHCSATWVAMRPRLQRPWKKPKKDLVPGSTRRASSVRRKNSVSKPGRRACAHDHRKSPPNPTGHVRRHPHRPGTLPASKIWSHSEPALSWPNRLLEATHNSMTTGGQKRHDHRRRQPGLWTPL
mmetsp:Transcript_13307/g.46947  ORF Transcript_13307/g.46947 Transcript_13307/m.46947 type:complete len:443 (+) Transcript_13307:685-2013(+)